MRFGSLEVRWIFGESLPETGHPAVDWFVGSTPVSREVDVPSPAWPSSWREDAYLVIPGHADMGIKLRREAGPNAPPERLEFKGLVAWLGDLSLGHGAAGRLERWMKWSYPAEAVPGPLRAPFEAAREMGPITVRKKRLLRTIRTPETGEAVEIAPPGPGAPLRPGLDFELTRGEVAGSPFWTLAFEAFPYEPRVRKVFGRLATSLLSGYPGRRLSLEHSGSYPAWLQRLV